jgi:hypothetical protein
MVVLSLMVDVPTSVLTFRLMVYGPGWVNVWVTAGLKVV